MNNKINATSLNLFILSSIFLLLISILNPSLIFDPTHIKHWSTYHRDDIVFVYNSLLYTEGLEQQHLDHPSLFTFIIFPFFYKLAFYIGYIDFYDLSGFLESQNINTSLSKLFFISRVCIQLFSLGTVLIFYKIVIKFSNKAFSSFLISFFFIISTGFSSASNRIESGLIAVFFLLLAFYLFLKFIEKNQKKNLMYLVFVFILIFSGMMQKKIIYFALPFLFLSSILLIKKNELKYYDYKIMNSSFMNYKYLLLIMYLLVFFFISYKTIINNTFFLDRDLDFIFLIINYSGFNILFYLYIKYYQNQYYRNLLTYNIIFGSTYILYKYFLIYFFSAPLAIWSISFTNFLGHLNMFSNNDIIKGAFNFGSLILYGEIFSHNLKLVLLKYFFSFSFQSILLWINLILLSFLFKKIKIEEKMSFYVLFLGFLFMQSVILFRYEQNTYFLNSEFFLLFSLSIFLKHLKVNVGYIFGSIAILTILLISNITHYEKIKSGNNESYCYSSMKPIENLTYYKYWTSKFPEAVISKLCKDIDF